MLPRQSPAVLFLVGRLALTVGESVERSERRVRVVPIDGVQRIVWVDLVDRIEGIVWVVAIDRIGGIPWIDAVNGVEGVVGIHRIDRVQGIIRAQLIDRIEDVVVAFVFFVEAEFGPRWRPPEKDHRQKEKDPTHSAPLGWQGGYVHYTLLDVELTQILSRLAGK